MPCFNGKQLQQQLFSFYSVTYNDVFAISTSTTATTSSSTSSTRQIHRRRHNMWVRPWLLQTEEREAYHNTMAELYTTDIPGFTNFMRMIPEFFEIIKTRLEPSLARKATNYRAPISVGGKVALTIRYLATGESYTSLSCQFRVGRSTISKFLPEVYRARMSSPESTSDVLLLQMNGKNWKWNSGSGGMFHMPWEPWMASMWP